MKKRFFRRGKEIRKQKMLQANYEQKLEERTKDRMISSSLEENIQEIVGIVGDSAYLVTRRLSLRAKTPVKAAVMYFDEMVNKDIVQKFLIRPLLREEINTSPKLWESIIEHIVQAGETKEACDIKSMTDGILTGDTILFVDGLEKGLIIGTKGWTSRGVGEPRSEAVIRGPREGMSETSNFSMSMIRHRLKDPDLRVKSFKLGTRTQTHVDLIYIKGLTNPEIVDEITKRLEDIKIDGVLETGYIEEMIQDQTWSPFPQLQNTERPDAVVGHLLEGKVAILTDGTPHALIAPAIFAQFYHSPEDYYERYLVSSFLRLVRVFSLFIALLAPAIYIAFVSFHPDMIPAQLMLAMAAGRATVPFTSIIEALVMELSVEILREASIRLPGPIGPTIGIVGALVIGDAAVSAGLVSPLMVIIVGLTTISSYANPSYNAAISVRLLRFPLMVLASVLGVYGIMLGIILILLHLVQLYSFHIPYMSPYAPLNLSDLRDSIIRVPWKAMNHRPSLYRPQQSRREGRESNE